MLCLKHGYSLEWKIGETSRLADNGKSITCTMDNFVLLVVPGLSSVPAAVCLQHRAQQISKIIPDILDYYQIQSRLEVTSMHAGNRCWQILTHRPREAVNQHTNIFPTNCTRRIQRKVFLIGYSPSQLISRTWRCTCLYIHLKERIQIRDGDASKVGIQKWKHSILTNFRKYRKGSSPRNRRDWWLENSGAQKWISEQSPVRFRGTRSHYSVDTSREKPKLHKRRRRICESFWSRHRCQKIFVWTIFENSANILKNYHGIIGQLFLTDWRQEIAERAVTSSKRRHIRRIIAIWIEWRMMVRFHEMPLLSARCPKPAGKREIWDTNEDLVNHSKDQFFNLTHWFDISQKLWEKWSKISPIWKARNLIGYASFAEEFWEKDILITDIGELEKRWSMK